MVSPRASAAVIKCGLDGLYYSISTPCVRTLLSTVLAVNDFKWLIVTQASFNCPEFCFKNALLSYYANDE